MDGNFNYRAGSSSNRYGIRQDEDRQEGHDAASPGGESPAARHAAELSGALQGLRDLQVERSRSRGPAATRPDGIRRSRAVLPGQSSSDASRPSQATREALEKLGRIRQRFQALIEGNWAPGEAEKVFDEIIMPTLVATENARKPGLTLLEDANGFRRWLLAGCSSNGKRAILPLPGYEKHAVVADIRRMRGKTSVLLIDPATPDDYSSENYLRNVLPGLHACLPPRAALVVIGLNTQKSLTGCRIFGLTTASKLVDQKPVVDGIHRQNLSGEALQTGAGVPAREIARLACIRVIDGAGVLPADFYKHSQSSSTLRNWMAASPSHPPDTPVNRKGQSLDGRFGAHSTERYSAPYKVRELLDQGVLESTFPAEVVNKILSPRHTSNSIEHKRLALLDRAMNYLRNASPRESDRESLGLLNRLQAASLNADDILALDLRSQDLGPHPSTL